MHVFMRDGNQRRWLTDVDLKDGFCPCIGVQDNHVSSNAAPIEPAIWCKVLVLDSISIDCNSRTLRWSTSSEDDDDDNTQNQYCINEECSGYDTEDELFDLARAIIERSREDGGQDDSKMPILRMLHCFILPKVSFHKNDIRKVEMAKAKQIQSIKALDIKLKAKCYDVTECQEELDVMREQFLPDLEQLMANNQCPKKFLELLKHDLQQEVQRLKTQIDKAQDEVESAKLQESDNCNSAACQCLLCQTRKQRNSLNKKLEMILFARETIILEIDEMQTEQLDCHHPDSILQKYFDKREALQKLKDERAKLTEQKNCALSVREMLDEILNDLNTNGYSEADDADSKGMRSTDVLQNVWYPEWQKLSERVATIVHCAEHPVGISFKTFCSEIHEICQDLIKLGRLSSGRLDARGSVCSTHMEPNGVRSEDQLGSSYDSYGFNDFIVDSYRDRLAQLKDKIHRHLDQMTDLLSEQFNNKDSPFRNKLRLAYEHCFYEREHEFIECVYELAHHEHVASLESDIKRLKKLPIRLLQLPMRNEWWHEIFEQRIRVCELNGQVFKPLAKSMDQEDDDSEDYEDGSKSEDDFDDMEDKFGFPLNADKDRFLDTLSVRSFFINHLRDRSKTFTSGLSSGESDSEDEVDSRVDYQRPKSCGPNLSASAPSESRISLDHLINQMDAKPIKESLKRKPSKSFNEISQTKSNPTCELQQGDTFEDHFGPALQHMKDMFKAISVVAKLKCLTASLRKIASKVSELRMRDGRDSFSSAVTAEDLLPLLVLMMLQLEPCDAASMWPQLALLEDLMAPCLTAGCHGWALVEFQMAQKILAGLCSEF